MPIKFIYFDLGNVILNFDREIGFRALAELTGCSIDQARSFTLDGGLLWEYEAGQVTSREFYDRFCRETDTQPDCDAFHKQASDIFHLNPTIPPVLAGLQDAGWPLGLLSNIAQNHWEFVSRGRYALVPDPFDVVILSYEIGVIKHDKKIFQVAIERAGFKPEEIFYIDDVIGHVESAREVGIDAVQYTNSVELVNQLRMREIHLRY